MWLQFSKKVADGSERKFAVTESKFLPRCQNPQFCGFVPRGKLVGECLPQTLLWRLAPYGISQSEFLRQAIRRTAIRPIIHVSAVNDELLSAVGKLTAEYGRIGGNLNQIARYLNEYGVPYNALSGEVRAAIADLAALKYEVLQKVGDAVGNTQAYQL